MNKKIETGSQMLETVEAAMLYNYFVKKMSIYGHAHGINFAVTMFVKGKDKPTTSTIIGKNVGMLSKR
jgi:hypothetical protein